MSTIAAFNDFMLATREAPLSGTDQIQNEATKYRTYLLRKMLAGLSKEKLLQSGTKIVDYIQLALTSTYQDYAPTQDFTFQASNSLTKIEVPWKFSLVSSNWTDHEIELNSGGDLKTVFKTIKKVKEQEMMTALYEGMEDAFWATPDVVEMEGGTATGKKPYSLRCFITPTGGAPAAANGGVVGADWTTVMTVNPTTLTNWKNQVENYDGTSATTVRGTNGIIPAMDRMWLDTQFESPTDAQQYAQDTKINKTSILASKVGYSTLVDIMNSRNDRMLPAQGGNDLGYANGRITYHGMPISYIGALDTVDATLDAAAKPNFRFVNFNYIYPIFHTKRYMTAIDLPNSARQPFSHGIIRDTWRNLWCSSRRSQGFVSAS